jgi:hypothetical protein
MNDFGSNRQYLAKVALGLRPLDTPLPFSPVVTSRADSGLVDQTFDLSNFSSAGAANLSGEELYFMRDGSSAGARLDLNFGGQQVFNFAPGQFLRLPFNSFTLARSFRSSVKGYARLVAVAKDGSFGEKIFLEDRCMYRPTDLIGTLELKTYSNNINYGDLPTWSGGTIPTDHGECDIRGWSQVRWVVSPGANTTALTVVPWFGFQDATDNANWFQQSQAAVSLNTSAATLADQILTFDLTGMYDYRDTAKSIAMFLQVTDATGGTTYQVACQGLQ